MRIGRRIERLQFVAGILVSHLGSPHATRPEAVEWLLDVCDSAPIYSARNGGAPRLSRMMDLLLHDDGHPMSLVFLRLAIERDLDDLARSLAGERERGLPGVPDLPDGETGRLDSSGDDGVDARAGLAEELRTLSAASAELSDRISRRYFALVESDAQALAT